MPCCAGRLAILGPASRLATRGPAGPRRTSPRPVIDSHCHLDACEPSDAELVARAREAGVTRIATVGTNGSSIDRALSAAHAHEEVFAVVGRHPHDTVGFDAAALEEIERAAADPRARAIGETGLDYYRDHAPRADQRRAFEAQLDVAARLGMPVVIHTRAAERDTLDVLHEYAGSVSAVILHCFSAVGRLEDCVERGYICSFAGNVTYPKATDLQRAAREVPAELLLVETDAPYLAPQPRRGRPNEPANVAHSARFIAGLREVSYEELERTVESNAARVFRW
jgi:TatD DNase family protein